MLTTIIPKDRSSIGLLEDINIETHSLIDNAKQSIILAKKIETLKRIYAFVEGYRRDIQAFALECGLDKNASILAVKEALRSTQKQFVEGAIPLTGNKIPSSKTPSGAIKSVEFYEQYVQTFIAELRMNGICEVQPDKPESIAWAIKFEIESLTQEILSLFTIVNEEDKGNGNQVTNASPVARVRRYAGSE